MTTERMNINNFFTRVKQAFQPEEIQRTFQSVTQFFEKEIIQPVSASFETASTETDTLVSESSESGYSEDETQKPCVYENVIVRTSNYWVSYQYKGPTDVLLSEESGKWMFFFTDKEFAVKMCVKAIQERVIENVKHSNKEEGVCCFYVMTDDTERHKKVLSFFLENDLIQKTKTGKLYNISFKLNDQTRNGEYGVGYIPTLKLEDFVDLYTCQLK